MAGDKMGGVLRLAEERGIISSHDLVERGLPRLSMRKLLFLFRRHWLFSMGIRAYIAVAGLLLTVAVGACASEVRTAGPESETDPEASAALVCPTPVSAAALPPQQHLARDIRTVLTGVKSPIQQEALAQAGRIAPGQMSDALREVLVDVAAFVSYVDQWDDTGDPRLDSLAHFLVCALQPHFSQEELVARIRAIMEEGQYGICGYEPPGWIFRQFPDTSVALLAEVITRPTTPLGKMSDGLELLSELAVSWKTGRILRSGGVYSRFSGESRALLIATARHFMEGDFLSSFPQRDTSGVYSFSRSDILYSAFRLAVALDDPGLIDILQELARDPDKVAALGIPDGRVKFVQEDVRRYLNWRPYMGISDC